MMRLKIVGGALLATLFVGIGALVGSVIGGVSAQTSPSSPSSPSSPPPAATPAPSTGPSSGTPNNKWDLPGVPNGGGFGMRGFGPRGGGPAGSGPEGFFGFGGRGGGTSADAVNREISATTQLVNLAKGDLAYANGKMDTSNVQ